MFDLPMVIEVILFVFLPTIDGPCVDEYLYWRGDVNVRPTYAMSQEITPFVWRPEVIRKRRNTILSINYRYKGIIY